MVESVLTREQLQTVLVEAFPGTDQRVVEVTRTGVVSRLLIDARHSRPGGTVAGPSIMSLADSVAWLAVMSRIGPVVLAVTTSLHIDFLRKAALNDLEATGEILKLGRRLAVVGVDVRSVGETDLVARAQVTYSIPPPESRG